MIELPFVHYQIGRFNINCKELTVDNGIDSIKLPVKVFELLKLFIENKEHSVIVNDAIKQIWNGNEGVGKRGFPNTIWYLRKTFSELGAQKGEIFKTVHKVGYVLAIKPVGTNMTKTASNTKNYKPASFFKLNKLLVSIIVVLFLTLSSFITFSYFIYNTVTVELTKNIVKETNFQGVEMHPAISHDGKFLAFRWLKESSMGHLYIKDLLNDDLPPHLLTNSLHEEASPAWSPDDSSIAYIRYNEDRYCQIRVRHLVTKQDELIDLGCVFNPSRKSLSWSPNGEFLLYSKKTSEGYAIFSYNFKTKLIEQQSLPKANENDVAAVWLKDSKSFVLIREKFQLAQLILINKRGKEQIILDNQTSIIGLTIDRKNEELYSSFLQKAEYKIHKYSLKDKSWQQVNLIARPANLSINPKTGKLYFSSYSSQEFMVQKTFESNKDLARVSSSSRDMFGSYSTVNNNIAFISNRSGSWDLWIKSKLQTINVTKGMGLPLMPSWSPVSEQFIVSLRPNNSEKFQLYIGDNATVRLTAIDLGGIEPKNPRWSFDGQSILFIAFDNNTNGVFRYDIESSLITKLTQNNEKVVIEGGDGNLYVSRYWKNGIWQINLETKEEKLIVEDLVTTDHGSFFWQDNAIYYVSRSNTKDIIKKRVIDGKTSIITTLPANSIKRYYAISSIDINSYLLTLNITDADIYSLEVFKPNS